MNKLIIISRKYKKDFVKTFNKEYFDSEKKAKNYFKEYLKNKQLFLLFIESDLAGFFAIPAILIYMKIK